MVVGGGPGWEGLRGARSGIGGAIVGEGCPPLGWLVGGLVLSKSAATVPGTARSEERQKERGVGGTVEGGESGYGIGGHRRERDR